MWGATASHCTGIFFFCCNSSFKTLPYVLALNPYDTANNSQRGCSHLSHYWIGTYACSLLSSEHQHQACTALSVIIIIIIIVQRAQYHDHHPATSAPCSSIRRFARLQSPRWAQHLLAAASKPLVLMCLPTAAPGCGIPPALGGDQQICTLYRCEQVPGGREGGRVPCGVCLGREVGVSGYVSGRVEHAVTYLHNNTHVHTRTYTQYTQYTHKKHRSEMRLLPAQCSTAPARVTGSTGTPGTAAPRSLCPEHWWPHPAVPVLALPAAGAQMLGAAVPQVRACRTSRPHSRGQLQAMPQVQQPLKQRQTSSQLQDCCYCYCQQRALRRLQLQRLPPLHAAAVDPAALSAVQQQADRRLVPAQDRYRGGECVSVWVKGFCLGLNPKPYT